MTPPSGSKASKAAKEAQPFTLEFGEHKLTILAGSKTTKALEAVIKEKKKIHGVRHSELLAVLYEQGRKDGQRDVFDAVEDCKSRFGFLDTDADDDTKDKKKKKHKKKHKKEH